MTRKELKGKAKEQIKGNIGVFFLCSLIVFIISIGMNFVPVVGAIVQIAFIAPIVLGYAKLTLSVTAGEKATVSKLFEGFSQFGKSICLYLLLSLYTFLWTLLLIVPGIIKGFSYSMSLFILAENPEMSSNEAISESRRMMKGHKWELFVLGLSFILWDLLSIITFGLAYIYVGPYKKVTIGNYYNYLKSLA